MPAIMQAVNPFFVGVDGSIVVTMRPVVDTSAWTIALKVRESNGGTVVFSVAMADGITVGGGDDNEVITIPIASAKTSGVNPGNYFYEVLRTNSGGKDVLALGEFRLKLPTAA